MTAKIHGFNRDGAMQTGKGEVVTIWSAHHLAATGLTSSLAELLADGLISSTTLSATNSFTSGTGVVYTSSDSYNRDYWAQRNLDRVINRLSQYANPVRIETEVEATSTAGSGAGTTGTAVGAGFFTGLVPSALLPGLTTEFGTNGGATATALVWRVQIEFEQKGAFNGVPVTATTKGEATIGAAGDNYGSSVANVGLVLDGLQLTVTDDIAGGGDLEGLVDLVVLDELGAAVNAVADTAVVSSSTAAADDATRSMVFMVEQARDIQS